MNRIARHALTAAVVLAAGTFASRASAIIVTAYDADTSLTRNGTAANDYAQQITLAGPAGPTAIYGYTLGLDWSNFAIGAQNLTIDVYTGANLSGSTPNALAGATLVDSSSVSITGTSNIGFEYSLSYGSSPVLIPSNTFTLVVTLDNASNTAFSSAVGGIFTTGSPTIGTNPGFVWNDANSDGIFQGSEQTNNIGGQPVNNIDVTVSVPEPASLTMFAAAAGLTLGRRRRRA